MPTRSLADPGALDELNRRLRTLRADSARRWGRMSPHQAVCHLGDALRMALKDAPPPDMVDTWARRTIVRRIALRAPFAWPRGAQTARGFDQEAGEGTRPIDFVADRTALERLHKRIAAASGASLAPAHPIFGPLTHDEWLIWAYRHSDHHLRQFGS